MSKATEFEPARDRDASPVFRGYGYQVDLTILRWLDLEHDDHLELECGEDIDLVLGGFAKGSAAGMRVLEQVKIRARNITLAEEHAVEFLSNSWDHQHRNPGSLLRHRFTTTAQVGHERKTPMPDRQTGIEAWERLRKGEVQGPEHDGILSGLRGALSSARRPKGIPVPVWRGFRAFVESSADEAFGAFVASVEWSTGTTAPESLASTVTNRLVSNGHAGNDKQAQGQYQKLFVFVFKLLTQPGQKLLDADKLREVLVAPSLGADDLALLDAIGLRLGEVERDVGTLQETQASILERMHAQEARLAEDRATKVIAEPVPPMLDMPPLVAKVSSRTDSVASLVAAIRKHAWVAVHGTSGMGKTHLAVLAAISMETHPPWLRLGAHESPVAAGLALDDACRHIAGAQALTFRLGLYERLAKKLGADALLVLEDLPRLEGRDELSQRMVLLCKALHENGCHLLTNSHFGSPMAIRQSLPMRLLREVQSPPLTDDEAAEIMFAYGAPRGIKMSMVSLLNAQAGGHPQVVAVAAKYMSEHEWKYDEAFAGLLGGQHRGALDAETINRLLATVEDEDTRQLLYRLTLCYGGISEDMAETVAGARPTVNLPRERFGALTGIWIQENADGQYDVSPLLSGLGEKHLENQTRRECRVALAQMILAKGALDLWDAMGAVVHFTAAEEFVRAGVVLTKAYMAMLSGDVPAKDAGLIHFWPPGSLPEAMPLGQRIVLRGLQIALRLRQGRAVDRWVSELDELLGQAGDADSLALALAAMSATTYLVENHPDTAQKLALAALEANPALEVRAGEKDLAAMPYPLENLVWICAGSAKRPEDIGRWLDGVASLRGETKERLFLAQLATDVPRLIGKAVWEEESAKSRGDQNWPELVRLTEELRAQASGLPDRIVWARLVAAEMLVLADFMGDIGGAAALCAKAYEQASDDSEARFILADRMASLFRDAGRRKDAASWFDLALAQPLRSYAYEKLLTNLNRASVSEEDDLETVRHVVLEAIRLADSSRDIPATASARAHGELAIVHWVAGDRSSSLAEMGRAVSLLSDDESGPQSDEWRAVVVLLSHTLGYMASMAAAGKPPNTADGRPYAPPSFGSLTHVQQEHAEFYGYWRFIGLHLSLSWFARGLGLPDTRNKWAERGAELAKRAKLDVMWAMLTIERLPQMIEAGQTAEAVAASVEAYATTKAALALREGEDRLSATVDLVSELGEKPSPAWDEIEHMAANAVLTPSVFRIGATMKRDASSARDAAHALASACRSYSDNASDRMLWVKAAELTEAFLCQPSNPKSCEERAEEFEGSDVKVLWVIYELAPAFEKKLSLSQALGAHMRAAQYAESVLRPSGSLRTLLDTTIAPYVSDFWEEVFAKSRFLFFSPALIASDLDRARTLPPVSRMKATIKAMAPGVGVRLGADWLAWLGS